MHLMSLGDSEHPSTQTITIIRVVSLSIAFYDYIITIPAEWRFYQSQRSCRPSIGCILFIAIRYVSMAALIISNTGYFGKFFSERACRHYYLVPAVFKVLQIAIVQLIMGIRTINISRRSTWVTWTILILFTLVTGAQCFFNMFRRVPLQSVGNNCIPSNLPPDLTVWPFYVIAMIYDIITLGISTIFLINVGQKDGKMARLVRLMLTDGLVYFVAVTGVNILNLIMYRSVYEGEQSAAVSLAYALTWIACQRMVLHLRDAAASHNRTATTQIVVSRALPSAYSISNAMRSQFETKDRNQLTSAFDFDWASSERPDSTASRKGSNKKRASTSRQGEGSVDPHEGLASPRERERDRERGRGGFARGDSIDEEAEEEFELDVQVQVEQTVTVEYDPTAFAQESYRTPRLMWGQNGRGRRTPERARRKSHTGSDGAAGT